MTEERQAFSMKILVIMGSPRKGNTYRAAERIREIIQPKVPVEWEYVMLKDAHLEDCLGCYRCFEKGEEFCSLKDEASLLEQKMKEADGVIFATPVYGFQVSYLMKLCIDRHAYIFHRPRFFRQKALLLTTAGIAGMNDVLKYLNLVARIWGFDVVARVGVRSHATFGPLPPCVVEENEERLQKAAEAFLAGLQKGTRSRPRLFDVIAFHIGRAPSDELGELAPADHTYWTDMGWLEEGKRYYVDVPVNPLYHAIGVVAEWYMRRRIQSELAAAG
jgi:multimeric flavodoxin WrbA